MSIPEGAFFLCRNDMRNHRPHAQPGPALPSPEYLQRSYGACGRCCANCGASSRACCKDAPPPGAAEVAEALAQRNVALLDPEAAQVLLLLLLLLLRLLRLLRPTKGNTSPRARPRTSTMPARAPRTQGAERKSASR